jgi:hypothetical protein
MRASADAPTMARMLSSALTGAVATSARAVALAAVVALPAVVAAPAEATMLVYRDGDDVWAASPDGAVKQRVTSDGTAASYYSFPSVDDAGTITAVKGASTTRAIWTLPRGAAQPTVNVMPWRLTSYANIGPTWARVNASGGSLAYTYLLNYGPWSGYPNGGFDARYAIVDPAKPGSSTQPAIDQPGQAYPSWFGNRLVTSRDGQIFFETQPLQFTSWLSDPGHPDLLAAEVNRAGTRVMVRRGDGRVVIAGWQGTVGSTAGTVTSQCLLPATGIAWAALSPNGTQVAWSDASGLRVATVQATNGTCPVSGTVLLSATGVTPAFSEATLPMPQDPTRREPGGDGRDPTDPGDPGDPGRDPTDPGGRDPSDPSDPGGRDPVDPGGAGRDPGSSGGDPADPGDRGAGGGGNVGPGGGGTVTPGGGRPQTTIAPSALRLTAPSGRALRAAALRRAVRVVATAPGAGTLRLAVELRGGGAASAAGRAAATRARAAGRSLVVGRASATVARAGRRALVVTPSRSVARALRRGARLTLTVTFTPKAGRAAVRRATVTVR